MEIKTVEQACRAAYVGAYRGLKQQGWRKAEKTGLVSTCKLRAEINGELRRCALGWLIPDAKLDYAKEVTGDIHTHMDKIADPLLPYINEDRFFKVVEALQVAHDTSYTEKQMEAAINNVAEEYGLGAPPV